MKVREAMTPWPYVVKADDTLAAAVAMMGRKGVHQVPVVDGSRIVGILTDGDVRVALGPDSRNTPFAELTGAEGVEEPVGHWASPTVRVVEPESGLSEAARAMAEERVGALPVVDEDGGVIGIVSVTDVLRCAAEVLEEYEGRWDDEDA